MQTLESLMEELREYTLQYYAEFNEEYKGGHICCLSPEHDDKNPSMSYYENGNLFHCFSCGRNIDIFSLANIYEGKVINGPDFIEDNVFYLAQKFGLSYENLRKDLTPEEKTRQEYFRTMKLFAEYVTINKNKAFLEERNILEKTANQLNIGSVKNFNDCFNYLVKNGSSVSILENIGISEFVVNENKLIIIIKDEYGRPVSFVSREMVYTLPKLYKINSDLKTIIDNKDIFFEDKCSIISEKMQMPMNIVRQYLSFKKFKYMNGSSTIIFDKSKIFYGWSEIKKKFNPLAPFVVLEGYLDFVTAFQRGINNAVSLGSASFTEEHINYIEKSTKIKTVAIAFDCDDIGKSRSKSFLDKILKRKTMKKYMFATYKESGKDFDEILNNNPSFRRTSEVFDFKDVFEYELITLKEKNSEVDYDSEAIFDKFVNIISKELEPKVKIQKAKILSQYLPEYPVGLILEQIQYVTDVKELEYKKEVISKTETIINEIKRDPSSAIHILSKAQDMVLDIDSKYNKKILDPFEISIDIFHRIEEQKTEANSFRIDFCFPWLKRTSLQPGDNVIISSLANIGKSTIYQNLIKNLIKNNDNVTILLASTDDPAQKIISNLIATYADLNRHYTSNPFYHTVYGYKDGIADQEKKNKMYDLYSRASNFILELMKQKRLLILDVKSGIDNWKTLSSTVKKIAEHESIKNNVKILFLDSANKVTVDGISEQNARAEFLSENLKKLSEHTGFISFINFELLKLKMNTRLGKHHLAGSRRMDYDSSMIAFVYNPMRNLENNTNMYWEKVDKVTKTVTREPILVTRMEKTKAGANELMFKGCFYKLDTFTNKLDPIELDTPEHKYYEKIWEEEFNTKYINGF